MSTSRINYNRNINKILSETSKPVRMGKSGMNLMNKLLDSLNSKLVDYCLEHTNEDTMTEITARNAVEEALSGDLKRLAFAEGNRALALYTSGIIDYKPKYPSKRKVKGKKEKEVSALKLSRGISDLTSLLFPEATLQDETERILCEMIEDLAVNFSNSIHSKKKSNITEEDVRAALIRFLPQTLRNHALAEGTRMVFLYESGKLEEPSRKRIDEKEERKRLPRKAAKTEPKRLKTARKRKRSPSLTPSRSPKRRRKPSKRRLPKEITDRKTRERKVSRKRPVTTKKTSLREVPSAKVTPKKRFPRKIRKTMETRKRAAKTEPKKLKPARRRKRSPSVTPSRSPKRRRKPFKSGISKKLTDHKKSQFLDKLSRQKPPISKKAPPRKVTRKKRISKKGIPRKAKKTKVTPKRAPSSKVSRKKHLPKKTVSREVGKPRISRKRRSVSEKVPKGKATQIVPSRKRQVSAKRKRAAERSPIKVSPKTARKISEKEPSKMKLPLDEKIATSTAKEINRGTRKLNEVYPQKLPPQTLNEVTESLSNLLDELIEEMKLGNSTIRPEEVRQAVKKIFPPQLADLAVAHMSQIIMT